MSLDGFAGGYTAVNGQVIGEPVALKNGDVVNVGDVAIRVRFA